MYKDLKVAVVIPCFRVKNQLPNVIDAVPSWVDLICLIDDACPESSVEHALSQTTDSRVVPIYLQKNGGVGKAVKAGYTYCLDCDIDLIARVDGDGQMDLSFLSSLLDPIASNKADYSKGNRFFNVEDISKMPKRRILGNLGLSFMSKFSTGYWDVFDPNNGFNAITKEALRKLPFEKIDNRYFFESDLLFRLGLNRAKITDVPMPSIYENETSNLSITKSLFEFSYKHTRNYWKRIFYTYFLRDFNFGSLQFLGGFCLMTFGTWVALTSWIHGMRSGIQTQVGTQILVAMTILSGIQFTLGFFSYDINRQNSQKD